MFFKNNLKITEGGALANLNAVNCCNIDQVGRVFPIPPSNKMRRALVFLDECEVCGKSRALIKNVEFDGSINTVVNRSDKKALKLLKRYKDQKTGLHKVENGSKNNMGWLWWDGLRDLWVRDFNNKKIFELN